MKLLKTLIDSISPLNGASTAYLGVCLLFVSMVHDDHGGPPAHHFRSAHGQFGHQSAFPTAAGTGYQKTDWPLQSDVVL